MILHTFDRSKRYFKVDITPIVDYYCWLTPVHRTILAYRTLVVFSNYRSINIKVMVSTVYISTLYKCSIIGRGLLGIGHGLGDGLSLGQLRHQHLSGQH